MEQGSRLESKSPLRIPANAPFSESQRHWLAGFLAGVNSRVLRRTEDAADTKPPVTILYGTQTGNSEELALRLGDMARSKGMNPSVLGMDDFSPEQFPSATRLLIVISTYGEGEMPDNAQTLWDSMSADTAPQLEHVNFSILALGDTNYDEFCQAGKDWDARLEALGATRVLERVDCDVDYEANFASWSEAALAKLLDVAHTEAESQATSTSTKPMADARPKATSKWSKKNPFPAKLLVNRVLTGPGSSKETRHFEISLEGSGLEYTVGDALGVAPTNCERLVDEIVNALGVSGDEPVPMPGSDAGDKPLRQALFEDFEIKTPTPKFVARIAELSGNLELRDLLQEEQKEALKHYLWGREVIDLLTENPTAKLAPDEFVALLSKLNPRLYSIASSIAKHPGEVHLTVASVRYESLGRERKGVCSTYLADRVPLGETLPVFIAPNKNFGLPDDDALPVIMVGPGTGIAPFRAFLEEREVRNASGKNWLFFGDRTREHEFLYADELNAYVESGLLTRLDLAFSREQKDKIYVQDRMREHGAELFEWLEAGGYFFVCGDASRMAKDVDTALHDVIAQQGGLSEDDAAEYVKRLKKEKRYVRDVY